MFRFFFLQNMTVCCIVPNVPRKTLCRGFVAAARGAAPDPADILKMSAKRLPRKPRKRGLLAILRRCRVILRGRFGQALRERVERDVERGRKT